LYGRGFESLRLHQFYKHWVKLKTKVIREIFWLLSTKYFFENLMITKLVEVSPLRVSAGSAIPVPVFDSCPMKAFSTVRISRCHGSFTRYEPKRYCVQGCASHSATRKRARSKSGITRMAFLTTSPMRQLTTWLYRRSPLR